MEQVSKNSTGGAAGARGACGWDPLPGAWREPGCGRGGPSLRLCHGRARPPLYSSAAALYDEAKGVRERCVVSTQVLWFPETGTLSTGHAPPVPAVGGSGWQAEGTHTL